MTCCICNIDVTDSHVKDTENGKYYCIECFVEVSDDIDEKTKKEAN
jgi:hypothetical protein